MSDNYQAVYDAVRSRFHDPSNVIREVAQNAFDISWMVSRVEADIHSAINEWQRPSVLFRPKIYMDGTLWCALYGDNLQEGVAGFGESPALAMYDFDKNWNEKAPQR